jgi:hypothetical protein
MLTGHGPERDHPARVIATNRETLAGGVRLRRPRAAGAAVTRRARRGNEASMTEPPQLPRRGDDTPPDWWEPYKAEFLRWRAWRGMHQFWARLPGTMRACHADDPAGLASQIRAATASAPRPAHGQE